MMMDEDLKYLELLAIFHYVLGGVTALFACLPLFHVAFGTAIALTSRTPQAFIGLFMLIFGVLFVVMGWGLAICIAVAGRRLATFRSRTFCIVVAAFECLLMPFGTVLGILTIIVLSKDSVIERFGPPSNAPHRL